MERLTIRSKNSDMVWFKDAENGNAHLEPCEMTAHHNRMALDKLAAYEDAEEQGLLLRLPCKVGQEAKKVIEKYKAEALEDIEAYGEDAVFGYCPVCGNLQSDVWNTKYCGDCGQRLDWSGEE